MNRLFLFPLYFVIMLCNISSIYGISIYAENVTKGIPIKIDICLDQNIYYVPGACIVSAVIHGDIDVNNTYKVEGTQTIITETKNVTIRVTGNVYAYDKNTPTIKVTDLINPKVEYEYMNNYSNAKPIMNITNETQHKHNNANDGDHGAHSKGEPDAEKKTEGSAAH